MNIERAVWRFVIFGLLGLLLEVLGGAILNLLNGNWIMSGSSSPWMILDYGLLGIVLIPIANTLKKFKTPLAARAIVYMLGIYTVEYVSGRIFTAAGLKIWNYSNLPYNLHGQIALYFAPLWCLIGLIAELIYPKIDMFSMILAGKIKLQDIEKLYKNQDNHS